MGLMSFSMFKSAVKAPASMGGASLGGSGRMDLRPFSRVQAKLSPSSTAGPYMSITACTALETPGQPYCSPSYSGWPAVKPIIRARCPPAESPMTPNLSGMKPYSLALARHHRTAVFTSKRNSGNLVLGARR